MFRALLLFTAGQAETILEPPLSITLVNSDKDHQPRKLSVTSDSIFTTAVGHSSKRTLASWHVTSPQEVVDHLLELVKEGEPTGISTPASER
jgi:trehalose 6-phosphate synthase/phosphatase